MLSDIVNDLTAYEMPEAVIEQNLVEAQSRQSKAAQAEARRKAEEDEYYERTLKMVAAEFGYDGVAPEQKTKTPAKKKPLPMPPLLDEEKRLCTECGEMVYISRFSISNGRVRDVCKFCDTKRIQERKKRKPLNRLSKTKR